MKGEAKKMTARSAQRDTAPPFNSSFVPAGCTSPTSGKTVWVCVGVCVRERKRLFPELIAAL